MSQHREIPVFSGIWRSSARKTLKPVEILLISRCTSKGTALHDICVDDIHSSSMHASRTDQLDQVPVLPAAARWALAARHVLEQHAVYGRRPNSVYRGCNPLHNHKYSSMHSTTPCLIGS